jgi:hypothetical protein
MARSQHLRALAKYWLTHYIMRPIIHLMHNNELTVPSSEFYMASFKLWTTQLELQRPSNAHGTPLAIAYET